MLLEPIISYKSTWRILELMTETPGELLTRQEILQNTRLGNESLGKALNKLRLSNIIIQIKEGKKESYKLNQENEFSQLILRMIAREKYLLNGINYNTRSTISEFIRELLDKTQDTEEIRLFGSVAKGIASPKSDIDIAIISKNPSKNEPIIRHIAMEIKTKTGREIQPHLFTPQEFKQNTPLTKEVKRGICISGCQPF